jgi:outer membrane receptor for ferrienterochelin and colicins
LELLGAYELPIAEKMLFSFSYTDHENSIYGDMPYLAKQRIGFGQLTWDKEINNHDLLLGLPSVTNITMTTLPQQ